MCLVVMVTMKLSSEQEPRLQSSLPLTAISTIHMPSDSSEIVSTVVPVPEICIGSGGGRMAVGGGVEVAVA